MYLNCLGYFLFSDGRKWVVGNKNGVSSPHGCRDGKISPLSSTRVPRHSGTVLEDLCFVIEMSRA